MKRKLAVWLLRQFSIKERRDIVMASMDGMLAVNKRMFLAMLIPDGYHLHENPRKKKEVKI